MSSRYVYLSTSHCCMSTRISKFKLTISVLKTTATKTLKGLIVWLQQHFTTCFTGDRTTEDILIGFIKFVLLGETMSCYSSASCGRPYNIFSTAYQMEVHTFLYHLHTLCIQYTPSPHIPLLINCITLDLQPAAI